jgi:hypothetical protein
MKCDYRWFRCNRKAAPGWKSFSDNSDFEATS